MQYRVISVREQSKYLLSYPLFGFGGQIVRLCLVEQGRLEQPPIVYMIG